MHATPQPPKLLDQLMCCIRDNYYSLRTERAYVYWARWYIRFHGLRHPKEMGGREIQQFMFYLVNRLALANALPSDWQLIDDGRAAIGWQRRNVPDNRHHFQHGGTHPARCGQHAAPAERGKQR